MIVTCNVLLVSTKWGPSCHCYLLSWVRWTAFSSSWFSLMQPVNQAFISNAHEGSETASKCGINKSRGMGWGKQWIFAFPSPPLLLDFSPQVHSVSCSLTWSPRLGNGNEMSATQAIFNVNVIHSVMRLITFETHLNVCFDKCSTIRNQSLAGKADHQRYSCFKFCI